MTRQCQTITATSLSAGTIVLLGILTGGTVNGADTGYPPPPGPYRSEPSVWSDMPRSRPPEGQAGSDDGGAKRSASSSRMLPLPDEGVDAGPGSYGASNLFGSGSTHQQPQQVPTPPDIIDPLQQGMADAPAPPHFVPLSPPADQRPRHNDFSMDFNRDSRRAAATREYQRPEGRALHGYPAYAPAYHPGYGQYPGPYPPGQAMHPAPAPAAPAYPVPGAGRYAPPYPQGRSPAPTQDPYPETDTGAPRYAADALDASGDAWEADVAPAPSPDTVDSAVFRPTD